MLFAVLEAGLFSVPEGRFKGNLRRLFFAVGCGRKGKGGFEGFVKMRKTVESYARRNLLDGEIGRLQQRMRVVDLLFIEIIAHRDAEIFFEHSAGIALRVRKPFDDNLQIFVKGLRVGKILRKLNQPSGNILRRVRHVLQKQIDDPRHDGAGVDLPLVRMRLEQSHDAVFDVVYLFGRHICLFCRVSVKKTVKITRIDGADFFEIFQIDQNVAVGEIFGRICHNMAIFGEEQKGVAGEEIFLLSVYHVRAASVQNAEKFDKIVPVQQRALRLNQLSVNEQIGKGHPQPRDRTGLI